MIDIFVDLNVLNSRLQYRTLDLTAPPRPLAYSRTINREQR